nr:HlyD family type I secretion periplasmic adaptor subunit [Pseudomonadales bacterium]
MIMRIPPVSPREPRPEDARFRPAAIALRDGEPAMPGRWLLHAVFLLLAVLLAWAMIGRVDVVAVATGRVIPDGRSKVLQSLDGGIVRAIHVREGEAVQEGQVLLELDGAELLAELARVRGELQAERLALGAALALWRLLESGDADGAGPVLAAALREADSAPDAEQFALQAWLLESRLREQARRRDALVQRLDARMAAQRAIAANLVRLEHGVPILVERAASARELHQRHLLARQQWQQQDLERVAMEQELQSERERGAALEREIAEIAAEREAFEAGSLREALLAVEARRRGADALARDRERLEERAARLELRSPAAGTVQQLAVRAVGAVLEPAEPVLVVVPRDAALEVEAFVLNRDIGFVGSGQQAAVKVDTFEFTRYGLLPARVRSVSAEAVEHPQFGAVYPARVALERDWIAVGEGRATLAPGMAVQVEIRTGTRKIIDYFLSPLGRVVHDSIRER